MAPRISVSAYAAGSDAEWLDQVAMSYPVRPIALSASSPRDLDSDGW